MDLLSADLLWSFFVAATTHYRKDSLLWPFPKDYVNSDGEKDFAELEGVLSLCPDLTDVNNKRENVDPKLLKLLRWVLNPKGFILKHLNNEKFQEICLRVEVDQKHDLSKVPKPDYIFEVMPSAAQNKKFLNAQGDLSSLYAFHGSQVQNFYSILNNGLKNNLNKASLYGEGTYLSSDLSMVMNYSPLGRGWKNSVFGESISCVAVCEMIDHPDVKCTLKFSQQPTGSTDTARNEVPIDGNVRDESKTCFSARSMRSRSRIKGSVGGDVPEKYFVVRNDDVVRIKYLFVYAPGRTRKPLENLERTNFFRRHKFFLVMLMYVVLLLVSGLCSSKRFWTYLDSLR